MRYFDRQSTTASLCAQWFFEEHLLTSLVLSDVTFGASDICDADIARGRTKLQEL